MTKSNTS